MNTLLSFPPGIPLTIRGFAPDIPDEIRSHLLAWGLLPGAAVRIVCHRPVTRLMIEHTELAVESHVAAQVLADKLIEQVGLQNSLQ